ncbi:MAG: hypothetical protein EB015_01925 [Methylocystaceae bacterium]|nr:hypothetical protein [Methylocystaceae bacterium]
MGYLAQLITSKMNIALLASLLIGFRDCNDDRMKASMLFLYQIKSNCLSFADVKKSSLAQQRINRWQSS